MYCTLQEAYNVPSFDPTSQKKRTGNRGCAAPAERPDPTDPYSADTGREFAAAPRPFGREDFTGGRGPVEKVSYGAMANDYKYYCDTYGVCADPMPPVKGAMAEGFENPKAAKGKRAPRNAQQCGPLQPPPYEYPMRDEDKKKYNRALQYALYQEQAATAAPPAEPRKADMDQVTGYYDEDLELYLQTKDMKASPVPKDLPKVESKAQPYDPKDSPFAQAMDRYKDQSMGGPLQPYASPLLTGAVAAAPRDRTGMWMDMVFFILIGVLLVILCDQLVKLGTLLGMKTTLQALAPLLSQIELEKA
jgi:hypothetical protein